MADIIISGTAAGPASLGTGRSGAYGVLTFADAYDMGLAFLRGHGAEASSEVIRRAVQEAHLDIINGHDWPTLEGRGRIHLHAAQTTGTVTYTHSTRTLVLAGATWPTWVEDGTLRLDGLLCGIETYVNSTTLILDSQMNPGKNLAALTTYSLSCCWYPLPVDFVNFTGPAGRDRWAYGQPVSMAELAAYQRNYNATGPVQYYAIGECPSSPGTKAIFPWPFAVADDVLDFTYQRRVRELQYSGQDADDMAGTIAVVAGSNAVTGSSSTFETEMAGAMLLIGRDNTNYPTGRYGLHRYAEQKRIHSVTTATAMALTSNVSTNRGPVKYRVTDPIDIETCAQNAFMRYVEMHLAMTMNVGRDSEGRSAIGRYTEQAEKAMREAMAASYPTRYDPAQARGNGYGALSGTVDWDEFGA